MKFLQSTFLRGENNDNFFNITFDMTPGFHEAVDFTIEISGTAGNGDDYTLIAEAQSITAQQYGLNIQTQIIDDNIYEGEETAVLRIRVNHNVVTVDPDNDTFELIIDDDDPKPTLRATAYRNRHRGRPEPGHNPRPGPGLRQRRLQTGNAGRIWYGPPGIPRHRGRNRRKRRGLPTEHHQRDLHPSEQCPVRQSTRHRRRRIPRRRRPGPSS